MEGTIRRILRYVPGRVDVLTAGRSPRVFSRRVVIYVVVHEQFLKTNVRDCL